jgi:hypothetical protein
MQMFQHRGGTRWISLRWAWDSACVICVAAFMVVVAVVAMPVLFACALAPETWRVLRRKLRPPMEDETSLAK